LTKDPELAVLWANEMTEGKNRSALLEAAGIEMLRSNPLAALSLGDRFPTAERRQFLDSLLGAWAQMDTDAALGWAQQVQQPEDRDAALNAIRQVAPVGIGTQLAIQDGYAVITGLLPGAPAAQSGQIHEGDRIVGVVQGDGVYVDVHNIALQDLVQVIRGTPGSLVQLQVVSADAAPESAPRTVSIVRDQIRHKQ
jgi:hypothetical protein